MTLTIVIRCVCVDTQHGEKEHPLGANKITCTCLGAERNHGTVRTAMTAVAAAPKKSENEEIPKALFVAYRILITNQEAESPLEDEEKGGAALVISQKGVSRATRKNLRFLEPS